MASFMALHGARLVDNGYAVIPIMPGTKKPGRFVGGAWRDYPGWSKHCSRPMTDNEIAIWSQWPDAGIGIAGGTVAAVDIDVADGEVALRIADLARERLGETTAMRIGRPPKRLLVYRTEAPFKGIKLSPIERGWKLAQALAVVSGTSFADCADQSANSCWPSFPSAPFSAMPIRIHES